MAAILAALNSFRVCVNATWIWTASWSAVMGKPVLAPPFAVVAEREPGPVDRVESGIIIPPAHQFLPVTMELICGREMP
jgi:hypothetical protein